MLNKLIEMNETILKLNLNDEKKQKKHLLIKEILNDKYCFLKMDIKYAYSILRDLGIKEEELINVYCQLINI